MTRAVARPAFPLPFVVAAAAATALGWPAQVEAQAPTEAAPAGAAPTQVTPVSIKLGYERLRLPDGERMGLTGLRYLLQPLQGVEVGPAVYGAISGRRGGLFVLGGELALRLPLARGWTVDAGVFAGGGGGGSAPVGSGLLVRPHVELLAPVGPVRAGVSWSKTRFPDGRIDSGQFGLVLVVDDRFTRTAPGEGTARADARGTGTDRVVAVAGAYRPRAGSQRTTGAALGGRIGIVGARFERRFGNGVHAGLETSGAASGDVGGYAEVLGTASWDALRAGPLEAGVRAALGMAGGGLVEVGGGLLTKVAAYARWNIDRIGAVGVEAGIADAPDGRFRAPFIAANVVWPLEARPGAGDGAAAFPVAHTEWTFGVERYDAARRDGTTRPLSNVVVGVRRFVAPAAYLSFQAHSAFDGGAGGYSVGLVGAGTRFEFAPGWRAGAEVGAGAGAGGGVDTGGGALARAEAYVERDIGVLQALRLGVARVASRQGRLDSTAIQLAWVGSYGVARPR